MQIILTKVLTWSVSPACIYSATAIAAALSRASDMYLSF